MGEDLSGRTEVRAPTRVAAGALLSALAGAGSLFVYLATGEPKAELFLLPAAFGFVLFRGIIGKLLGIVFCMAVAVASHFVTLAIYLELN